jgi:hypothetical protein
MSTVTAEKVIETLAAAPSITELQEATRLSLPDLIRFGSTQTKQEVGGWGSGETACALSAAAYALEALDSL